MPTEHRSVADDEVERFSPPETEDWNQGLYVCDPDRYRAWREVVVRGGIIRAKLVAGSCLNACLIPVASDSTRESWSSEIGKDRAEALSV